MSESAAAALADRVARLERAHRRLQRCGAALLLCVGAVALIAAGGDGMLEGRSLKLVDADGKTRIIATPASGLSFLDDSGKVRAILGVDADGPGLVLYGEASRAVLNLNRDGPALAFTGTDGALRAILALVKDGPGLVLFDAAQRARVQLTVRGDSGTAAVLDAHGTTIWQAPARPR